MSQSDHNSKNVAAVVKTSQGYYRAIVGQGVIESIGREMASAGLQGRAYIIADQALFPAGARRCQEALEVGGFATHVLAIPSGEQAKTLETARSVFVWLAERRAERSDTIVALGGGVTGDLAGFVAATWLRGVPFVQAPTSLAAMVDASIGGKVAVNLPVGKNLVGAFHQPRLVVAEIDYLKTLPRRELASGWAEAIKHGLILDATLLDTLERGADEVLSLTGSVAVEAIRRSVAVKAEVVSADEFETGDARVLLNYGHTVGHALEAVTGYGRFLHGEAVSIGMMAAARIARRLGMISQELVDRQRSVLERYGLPVRTSGVSVDAVLAATKSDKKVRGGSLRWVLVKGPGKATTRRDVPDGIVRDAVSEVLG